MSNWTDTLLNPEKFKHIFRGEAMSLDAIELHEVLLHRDGPRVTLRFDLDGYPQDPPPKWAAQGCNRVQVQLTLIGVKSLSIQGWSTACTMDLSLVSSEGKVRLSGSDGVVAIDVLADFVDLGAVTAYVDGARAPAPNS